MKNVMDDAWAGCELLVKDWDLLILLVPRSGESRAGLRSVGASVLGIVVPGMVVVD